MKKTACIFLLGGCMMLLSGCSLIFEEPSALILPPATTQANYEERALINTFLAANERLEVPENMASPAASVNVDINGDGQDEKMVFFSRNDDHEVGALLMQQTQSGEWNMVDQIRQYGSGIDYFSMEDVDGDGAPEACIGVDIGGYRVLYIYRMGATGFTEADQINYSHLQMVDIDGKGQVEILSALNDIDATTPMGTFYRYVWKDNTLSCVYQQEFDGNCVEMQFGKVSAERNGVYLVRTGDYANLNIDLLLPNGRQGFDLQLTARGVSLNTTGGYTSLVGDMTGDGILDVRFVVVPVEASKRDVGDFLQVWKNWDGKGALDSIYGVIENNTDGYTVVLPEYCLETVRYQFINEKGSSQLRIYDGDNQEAAVVFYSQTADAADATRKIPGIISLGSSPSHQRTYFAQCNAATFAGKPLNDTLIKDTFQIEGGKTNDE